MIITKEIELEISGKAVIRGDELAIVVSGSMPYKDRVATSSIDSGFSQDVYNLFEAAFAQAIEEVKDQLIAAAEAGRSEAVIVAARLGE